MNFFKGLFTRKAPLSSRPPQNMSSNNTFSIANPIKNTSNIEKTFQELFNAERRRNLSRYNTSLTKLRAYYRQNPTRANQMMNKMFNRSRSSSNLSSFSNQDLQNTRNLISMNVEGGKRNKKTRRIRRRHATRSKR